MTESRTIRVKALARVEGEGALNIRVRGDQVDEVQLNIYEPPRFFEAMLRGRALEEAPDINARICGICPVAYQMSSVHAMEDALGIQVSPEIRRLRRLLYCGEWIESHVLHMYLLNAPDFFEVESGIKLAERFPNEINRGLRLKKHGNQMLEVLGGRPIHPVNVTVGGFFRAPRKEEFTKLIPDFEWGLQAAIETTRWVAGFHFPEFERPYQLLSLMHPDEYPMNEGMICTNRGLNVPVSEFEKYFIEEHVAHSTALQSKRIGPEPNYLVGPLARINLNLDRLLPTARKLADEIGISWPCMNPYKTIIARGLEVVHAYEEALDILRTYTPPKPSRVKFVHRSGSGTSATEAPRGLLFHRYALDSHGKIVEAKIVPPTSQNQRQIEEDLRQLLSSPSLLQMDSETIGMTCERLVRTFDPCISCSTHFLKVNLERI